MRSTYYSLGLAHSEGAQYTAIALCPAPTLHGDSERGIKNEKSLPQWKIPLSIDREFLF